MKLYILDSNKIVEEVKTYLKENRPDLPFVSLVLAPLVLIDNSGKWYLTTKVLPPREVIRLGYEYSELHQPIVVDLYRVFFDGEELKIEPRGVARWLSSPREIMEDYSIVESSLKGWFVDENLLMLWTNFLFGLDR